LPAVVDRAPQMVPVQRRSLTTPKAWPWIQTAISMWRIQINHRIRKITPAREVSTLAGDGTVAQFWNPRGVAVDSSGNVYVADTGYGRIRIIKPGGAVDTLAGQFNGPSGVAVDSFGNVYVVDTGYGRIRIIKPAGVVSTLAGSTAGYKDATGEAAQFNGPSGVAVDSFGNVYVADTGKDRIRRITPGGVVITIAGDDTVARFNNPYGVAVDLDNNVYVTDRDNHRIRKITSAKVVSTFAGSTLGYNLAPATGEAAQFRNPTDVAVFGSGDNLLIYVADTLNNRIRKIEYK